MTSIFLSNSNSNWTFIALNLHIQEDSKAQQSLKVVDKISVSETERHRAILTEFLTRRVFVDCTGDFSQKLFSRHFWRPS